MTITTPADIVRIAHEFQRAFAALPHWQQAEISAFPHGALAQQFARDFARWDETHHSERLPKNLETEIWRN